jgi:hypothetical protein
MNGLTENVCAGNGRDRSLRGRAKIFDNNDRSLRMLRYSPNPPIKIKKPRDDILFAQKQCGM